ncbi:LLM class F420-dependent oxidoreductase [Spirilliplanes yamanashiensis]|uniref:LLM class F420-dependent oxidoreductase n=1 Tax=Spirilliplanes yamanashiensis TaxID=42233 RepID=A0A8J4DI14_9ACTN|nr:LLM class F420-dependent oxidoreductase [Spirilliplanes yamanashiensis]MDP9819605.1 F420-dependent oxidoreductase-like protein [Spirilliplanes yamanashiensis]GIJ01575.1 LLM class F420-dependent oxidoreductase [Spirilliplanes yamanashiensis]
MRLTIFTEPQQGAAHADLVRVAQHAEQAGYDGFFRSDHYLAMGVDGRPGPSDAWVSLGALAVQTSTIRLGTLVSSATFRLPGPLAITVAQVDEMSGGRIELGLGAGWFEAEHTAYGIPFPPLGERFDRLTEQLEIITGLWSPGTFSFAGKHYRVTDSPGLPKPVQTPRPPIIIGGAGRKRTPALAARHAAEFNAAFKPFDQATALFDGVRAACAEAGRTDLPALSAAVELCCGRDDAEVRRRADAIGRTVDDLRARGAAVGTPAEVTDLLGRYAEAGATRIHLQTIDLTDLDHLDLVAEAVAPQLP